MIHQQPHSILRVGIVGANPERGWAKDAHIPALQRLPQFRLTAVSARTLEIAEAAQRSFGADQAYADSLELVRDPHVDIVAVTVKVPEHHAIVMAALAAGKHVYCEWPLGRDLTEAQEMAQATAPRQHTMIGLQGVSAPALRRAIKIVREGLIGQPQVLRVFGSAAAWGKTTQPHYRYLQDRSNGATLETIGGGHVLAAVEALVGPYTEVDARNSILQKRIPVEGSDETIERTCGDHMLVLGQHRSGCVSTLEIVGGSSTKPALFELVGESGWLRVTGSTPGTYQIPWLELEASVTIEPPLIPTITGLVGPPANVAEAYLRFADDIESGTKTVPDFRDALRLSLLLNRIDIASRSGYRQRLDQ